MCLTLPWRHEHREEFIGNIFVLQSHPKKLNVIKKEEHNEQGNNSFSFLLKDEEKKSPGSI